MNNVVDVAFKLLIDNVELVDRLFKLVSIVVDVKFKLLIDVVCPLTKFNNVVDVVFKLLIDNVELVEKLFKSLFVAYCVKSLFVAYCVKSGVPLKSSYKPLNKLP